MMYFSLSTCSVSLLIFGISPNSNVNAMEILESGDPQITTKFHNRPNEYITGLRYVLILGRHTLVTVYKN